MKDLDFSTYSHNSQRKKRWPKERKDYYYSFNQLNPEGTDHLLLKGDILTSYEHKAKKQSPEIRELRSSGLGLI